MVYENVSMTTSLPTNCISAISHWKKYLSEFYTQDGGESQQASKLRQCHCNPLHSTIVGGCNHKKRHVTGLMQPTGRSRMSTCSTFEIGPWASKCHQQRKMSASATAFADVNKAIYVDRHPWLGPTAVKYLPSLAALRCVICPSLWMTSCLRMTGRMNACRHRCSEWRHCVVVRPCCIVLVASCPRRRRAPRLGRVHCARGVGGGACNSHCSVF